MAKDITSMFSGSKSRPTLDLKPEESLVLSTDFNLFYKPEVEPEIAGMKEFTASLSNFVDGALNRGNIAGEVKEKEVNYADAKKDYELNKGKFREAVKNGEIDVTGNPYYLEHYKELTLNSWGNLFAEKLQKSYENKGVIDDTRDGAFDNFYKAEMQKFVFFFLRGVFEAPITKYCIWQCLGITGSSPGSPDGTSPLYHNRQDPTQLEALFREC